MLDYHLGYVLDSLMNMKNIKCGCCVSMKNLLYLLNILSFKCPIYEISFFIYKMSFYEMSQRPIDFKLLVFLVCYLHYKNI